MATAVTSQKLASQLAVISYDHDPGTTAATITSPDGGTTKRYVPLTNYEYFGVAAMTSVSASSSGITKVEIVAASDSSGTGLTVVVDSGTVAADAVGDFVWVECTAAQVKECLATATHVGARITCSNSGDEAVVTYVRGGPRWPSADLTANVIS